LEGKDESPEEIVKKLEKVSVFKLKYTFNDKIFVLVGK
jgi:hypothetical protein